MAQYKEYGLENKVAIVTGAGSGIGRSCAVELAKGGAKVALFGRRENMVQSVREECLEYTSDAIALSVDVSDADAVKAGVRGAGYLRHRRHPHQLRRVRASPEARRVVLENHFDNMSPDEYLSFFRTHALGHYLMNLAVIPTMMKNHFGRIVSVTSVLGVTGVFDGPAYASSKAAPSARSSPSRRNTAATTSRSTPWPPAWWTRP
jgi:NADP-dependent 3-hydroxy acid dehydrogenase YdfG